jgi:hypothetical protein
LASVRGCGPKSSATPTLTDAEATAMMKTQVAWTGKYTTDDQTAESIKLMTHVDAASSQAIFDTVGSTSFGSTGNRMMVKGNVIVPMTGKTSVVEFELVDQIECCLSARAEAPGGPFIPQLPPSKKRLRSVGRASNGHRSC